LKTKRREIWISGEERDGSKSGECIEGELGMGSVARWLVNRGELLTASEMIDVRGEQIYGGAGSPHMRPLAKVNSQRSKILVGLALDMEKLYRVNTNMYSN